MNPARWKLILAMVWSAFSPCLIAQSCQATVGVPPVIRAEGRTELVGDLALDCIGGTPTPAGATVPLVSVTVSANVAITSQGMATGTPNEALLIVDEPNSGSQPTRPTLNCGASGAPDSGPNGPAVCQIVSTGDPTATYDGTPCGSSSATYGCGRPNIFQGLPSRPVAQANSTTFMVPFDPPGSGHRILRITNIRVDATQLPPGLSPASVFLAISINGNTAVSVNNPDQTVAFVQSGLAAIDTTGLSTPSSSVRISEGFGDSWKPKNISMTIANGVFQNGSSYWTYSPAKPLNYPGDYNQNVPGAIYNTESGFEYYSPTANPSPNPPQGVGLVAVADNGSALGAQDTAIGNAGIAGAGTRLALRFSNLPKGVSVSVPVTVYLYPQGCSGSCPASGVMVLAATDPSGAGGFSPISGSTAVVGNLAVYEVLFANPFNLEYADVSCQLSNGQSLPAAGVLVTGSFAPFDNDGTGSAIPRFAVPEIASIQSSPPGAETVISGTSCNPGTYATPTVMNWIPGSVCVIEFPLQQNIGGAQYAFTSAMVNPGSGSLPNQFSVTALSANATISAAFTAVPSIAPVTIQTVPSGLQFTVDGGALQTAPQTLSLTVGAHTIGVSPIQAAANGTRENFLQWSDGGTATHTMTVPVGGLTSLTATFQQQYLLTSGITPAAGGTVQLNPPASDGYFNSGVSVQVTASPSSHYKFSSWSGDLAGSANPQTIVMNAPHSVTAGFASTTPQSSLTITTSSLPDGLNSIAYPVTALSVQGGTAPYHWMLSSGALPGSMNLSTGGVLSGTPSGAGSFPITVGVTDSSTTPLSAQANFTLSITQPTTLLTVSPQQLGFVYTQSDTSLPVSQNVGILSYPRGTGVSVSSTTSDGGAWLSASYTGGKTAPGTVVVAVDPAKVGGPNIYSGQITILAPNATPSIAQVNVTFTVNPSQAPTLSVTQFESFALPQNSGSGAGSVLVSSTGGGSVSYTATASSDGGWLTLTGGASGTVTPSMQASVAFSLGTNISPGLHQGQITVSGAGSPQVANIALLVSAPQPVMQLSEAGLTFFAVEKSSAVTPPQSVTVSNLYPDNLSWTTQVPFATVSESWLSVTPSGSSSGGSGSDATFSVNPAGLPKGQYYALVEFDSAAANSPQSMTVLMNVVGAGELGSAPQLSTSGLVLVGTAGSATPVSQSITLFSPSAANLNYTTSDFTLSGGNWLSTPASGALGVNGTAALSIQANTASLSPGVNYGTVQIAFSDGTIQTVQVGLVVTAGTGLGSAGPLHNAGPACTADALIPAISAPSVPPQVAVASTYSATILDNCGNPATPATHTTADLVFSDGEAQVPMTFDPAAQVWTASWTPSTSGRLYVSVSAFSTRPLGEFIGAPNPAPLSSYVSVAVRPADTETAPQPSSSALNGASFDTSLSSIVVPGGYVSIFGSGLSTGSEIAPAPAGASLPSSLAGTQMYLQGQPLRLKFVSPGQVNGLIPLGLALNTPVQLTVVRADGAVSVPVIATPVDLQPGIFTTSNQGTGQGSILIANTSTIAGPAGQGQAPVARGGYLEIFATGLGPVQTQSGSPPPADGQPAPISASPLFSTTATATVSIGGVAAPNVLFSGLAPGYVGLYQVNVQVPAGAPTGDAVPIVLTLTDNSGFSASSQSGVTVAVQ